MLFLLNALNLNEYSSLQQIGSCVTRADEIMFCVESYYNTLTQTYRTIQKRGARGSSAHVHHQPAKTPLDDTNTPCKALEKNTSGRYHNIATPAKTCPYQNCMVRCRFRLLGSQCIPGKFRITVISALLFTSMDFNPASQTYAVLQVNKLSSKMDLNFTVGAGYLPLWGQTWVECCVP